MEVSVLDASFTIEEPYVDAPVEELERQLAAYEAGDRTRFDLPIAYPDSFTGRVMEAMSAIPYGETRTYGELAETLDTAAVAVGQACGRNPVPIVVPCHRVVGANGLGGYSSDGGTDTKAALLAFEAAQSSRRR